MIVAPDIEKYRFMDFTGISSDCSPKLQDKSFLYCSLAFLAGAMRTEHTASSVGGERREGSMDVSGQRVLLYFLRGVCRLAQSSKAVPQHPLLAPARCPSSLRTSPQSATARYRMFPFLGRQLVRLRIVQGERIYHPQRGGRLRALVIRSERPPINKLLQLFFSS